jgi:glycosyltransferase involved in cell wall biosynthesis
MNIDLRPGTQVQFSSDFSTPHGAQPRIAVVLPAYNEEQTVASTMEAFHASLPTAAIWVVNNRSSDATERVAREALRRLDCPGGVLNEVRPGKGNAVRRAFMEVDADIYVLADADLTYPAEEAHALIEPVLRGEADMVVGDRHSSGHYAAENKRALHGFGNRLVRDMVNVLFRAKLADIMSGYRVFSRRFVKTYPILVEGFEIETDMTLHALDKRFRIVP